MNRADGHDNSDVADFEVTHPMFYGDGQHIVLIGHLPRTPGQHLNRTGVLGVVEREDLRMMVPIADGTHK